MSQLQVNSYYPIDYFKLDGVDQIKYPDTFWWASNERYASEDSNGFYLSVPDGGAQTSEVLEIDLGRVREINYLNFDVIRTPLDITIEYDALSLTDGSHNWVPVTALPEQPFDNQVAFLASARNAWSKSQFYFTNSKGEIISSRWLRITFTRSTSPWPTDSAAPFRWPVMVKQLRLGRYISNLNDTAGILESYAPDDAIALVLPDGGSGATREVRQQFVFPANAERGSIVPTLLGFSVLVNAPNLTETTTPSGFGHATTSDAEYTFSVYNMTNADTPVLLDQGTVSGTVSTGKVWVRIDLNAPIEGDMNAVYELRINSLDSFLCNTTYLSNENLLSRTELSGTLTFNSSSSAVDTTVDLTTEIFPGQYLSRDDDSDQVYTVATVTNTTITIVETYTGSTQSGIKGSRVYPVSYWDDGSSTYVEHAKQNLLIRVLADIAEEGRDVLGNSYRYGTHRDRASYVSDVDKSGWMSAPQPAPDAVEALYFDVRGVDNGLAVLSLIDAIEIAPRTPGIAMNVYFTKEGLDQDLPKTRDEWDMMLWTPVQQTYTLQKKKIIDLPSAVRASFMKLEFTNLRPLPYRIPNYPELPPVQYNKYPTWVEQQFSPTLQPQTDDWFVSPTDQVQTKVLDAMGDPVQEFLDKEAATLAGLSLNGQGDTNVSSGLSSTAATANLDNTTVGQIFVNTGNMYQQNLATNVNQDTILGQLAVARLDPTLVTSPTEGNPDGIPADVAIVSSVLRQVTDAYAHMLGPPMRFLQQGRHVYKTESGRFNKKAFFAGLQSVRFLKSDPTVPYDDEFITDTLYNDELLEINTWTREIGSGISDGETVYVSYRVFDEDVIDESATDETVTLAANDPVAFSIGGRPAQGIRVFQGPNSTGLEYYQNDDYQLGYLFDDLGHIHTTISRSTLIPRLTVPIQPIRYFDVGTVIGGHVIPSPPTEDTGTVVGVGVVITTAESLDVPTFGDETYGAGVYGNPDA